MSSALLSSIDEVVLAQTRATSADQGRYRSSKAKVDVNSTFT